MILSFLKDIFVFDSHFPLLFTQFYFWAFFAFVFAGFSLLKNKILLRNTFLAFVSLFFYYKTSGLFVLILLFTTAFNFYQAKGIDNAVSDKLKKKKLIIGLSVNLLALFYFKYAYFITGLFNDIFGFHLQVYDIFARIGNMLAGNEHFDVGNILLPVGISFYTFQNISYIVDVFRKKVKPVESIFNFAFYVSFFPQLVAGPIVRANEFIPQIYKRYFISRRQFGIAIFWILNGLMKKIILSDYIAVNFVDRVFENPGMFSGFENLVALFGYSLQVYADFSGYTDIAIGVAMLMGFYLPKNFDSPYKATNPGNFWKRWHISLSKWLQDYLYIPLGGNRNATFGTYACLISIALIAIILAGNMWVTLMIAFIGLAVVYKIRFYPENLRKTQTNFNMMNTMLLGGLWHGASWNFMIWGGLNGLGILVYKFWKDINVYRRTSILAALTFLFVLLALLFQSPIFTIGMVWIAGIFAGTFIRLLYHFFGGKYAFKHIEMYWAVAQTFVFISFTRLFFRAGSNLNPVEANQTAWNTAKSMVAQIGGNWNTSQIDTMIYEYRYVFSMIIIGLIIHWLPDKWKRRYRLTFAQLPFVPMALVVVICIFIIYQFITADLQAFIYFQF
ncbi:MAG: MBOAT family protein [Dysgonamonadaceae bacterium]|jgi:D-alanyl-lipoteichoic acid acyltransferase DltB (MBOAT superfamily)|nr:MBOAT family protein [Dysgonamonadaceae bacterium]